MFHKKRKHRGGRHHRGMGQCIPPPFGGRTVNDLLPGERGTVSKVLACMSIRQRLIDLGITEGVEVEMVRAAPLGDPVEIRVRNTNLALRRAEAGRLLLETADGDNGDGG